MKKTTMTLAIALLGLSSLVISSTRAFAQPESARLVEGSTSNSQPLANGVVRNQTLQMAFNGPAFEQLYREYAARVPKGKPVQSRDEIKKVIETSAQNRLSAARAGDPLGGGGNPPPIKISCTITYPPLAIECTISMLSVTYAASLQQ